MGNSRINSRLGDIQVKAFASVIVHIPDAYESTVRTKSGIEFYLDSRFDDVRNTIRYGTVISSGDKTFLPGDEVFFHHNVIRRIKTTGHTVKNKSENFRDGLFAIPPGEIYGFKRKGLFKAVAPYCFIKPVPCGQKIISGIKIMSRQDEKPQWGILRYGNDQLSGMGAHDGDTIIFNIDSEYEYPVDGEKLYRMKTDWIIGKITCS